MDVFCPNCLHNVTLESTGPGEFSFDCPECAKEARVVVPENPSQRPIVRPVRSDSSSGDSQVSKSHAPKSEVSKSQISKSLAARDPFSGKSSSDSVRRPSQPSKSVSSGARSKRKEVDFPFEESDKNLVDVEQQPSKDEFDSPEYAVPQPLRGPVRTVRREPRPRQEEPGFLIYLMWMGGAAVVWLVLLVAGILMREAAWGMLVVGALAIMTARRTFLRIARKEGFTVWLGCLLVPFYTLFFSLAHFRQTVNPLLITVFGYGYVLSAFLIFGVHDAVDAHRNRLAPVVAQDDEDEDDVPQKGAAAIKQQLLDETLTLSVDGKEASITVDELSYFPETSGHGLGGESFEFFGPDVSLRGTFPAGFRDRWMDLLGNPVPISSRGNHPQPGDSHIKLPGRGDVKVTGGSFTIEGIVGKPVQQVGGSIKLEIGGPQKPETFEGNFIVRVKATATE